MQDKVFSLLGLAAKAGKAVSGGFSVEEAVKSRKARVVIIAQDAQQNTVKKFTDKCRHNNVALRFYGSKEELGRSVGKDSRACVAVTDRGFAQSLLKKLDAEKPGGSGDRPTISASGASLTGNAPAVIPRRSSPGSSPGGFSGGEDGLHAAQDDSADTLQRGSPGEPPDPHSGASAVPDDPLNRMGP